MYRIGEEEIQAVAEVIRSKEFYRGNGGPIRAVQHFEQELKEYVGTKFAFSLTSGKGALICALVGMGVGPGDEVIIPAYTYIATALSVLAVGAIPVIVNIDETLGIDPIEIEKNISKHTKAIIPVHMRGIPSNMDAIMAIAEKHNLYVLEDACQALGASYKGKKLGSIGHAGATSFNCYKNITAGEGGGLMTNDSEIFQKAFIHHDSSGARWLGSELDGFTVEECSGNEYRISDISGAILRVQLKRLDGIVADLRKNKFRVVDALKDTGLKLIPSNDIEGDCGNVMAFRFDNEELADKFANAVNENAKEAPVVRAETLKNIGKHIATSWDQVINKRGAFNDKMNPYLMKANKKLRLNYKPEESAKSVAILKRTIIVNVNPDWTEEQIAKAIEILAKSAKEVF